MLKHTLISVAVTSALLLSGCSSTATQSSTTQNSTPFSAVVQTPVDFGGERITLEQAMADPDWIGRQPETATWSADSKTVYFNQKQAGTVVRDTFMVSVEGDTPTPVPLSQLHQATGSDALLSADKQLQVYTFKGNVFTKAVNGGAVRQLTFDSLHYRVQGLLNSGLIALSADDAFFTLDLTTGERKEIAKLITKDAPKGVTEPTTYLAKNELKLIKYIAVEHQNAKDREARKKDLTAQNDTVVDTAFYLGKGKRIVASSLSPAGDKLVVALKPDTPRQAEHDIMPAYVTKDGNIKAVPARQRVAEAKSENTELVVINLADKTQQVLAYDTLPGFDEDVLASVKAENAKAQGKTYSAQKAPRDINLINSDSSIKWNRDGSQVALMLEAWDNKDRWIATIDKNSKLVSQHRLHDDAWINYTFNEFGWLNNSDTLYYLSEESGFSHLYTKVPGQKAKQLTQGQFEVSSLTIAANDEYAYFKANQKHPGIYEIYRVSLADGKTEALTALDGMTDYELSPDETKLLLQHSTVMLPTELYVKNLNQPNAEVKRLTYTVSDAFLNKQLVAPQIVAVPSSHGDTPIYAKVYYPTDYKPGETGKTRKAVIFNHGAGYLQNSHMGWSVYFREFMFHSLLANEGYVVMDMDYRASKGYGRDWRTAIYRQMGTPEIQDLADGVKWMAENANVNSGKVGTYGGSYGGFMTFMALFTAPELFQSGAALRPVADWAYYNTAYTSNILNTPDVDPIAYERSSPIFHAEGLNKPLLINAPMVDDNVFFHDVVRLHQRLIELEKQDFETAIFPVESHGFVQPSSWLDEYRRIYKLFKTTL
ncbi:prolyl oligopeptidase family serine peptidase [Pseudoalteromonas fenneropenaei]|uniref:Prolyl oligopeptidase family serine peptidase n=1 Tax=Pseudoalteromonas fenneropenaei TaxID=1737459 RepID=A0ABV7CFG5_9GAMM